MNTTSRAASFAMLALITGSLVACGGSHEKVHATDRVEAAAAQAIAAAPAAEPIKFDDHGQPTVGGAGGAGGGAVASAAATTTATVADPASAEASAPADTASTSATAEPAASEAAPAASN